MVISMNMQYEHGGDSYRNQVDYDFSININPLGIPQGSIQAAWEGVLLAGKYPDYKGEALCMEIAKAEGCKPEQIVLGNGASELLYGICRAAKVKKGLVAAPSFSEYENAIHSVGGTVGVCKLQEANGFAVTKEIASALTEDTDIFFLCNPNNPTGKKVEKELLLFLAAECEKKQIWFCIDECFLPFLSEEKSLTLKEKIEAFPHLIVLRAFTKVYGMPGLRLGYMLSANPKLREALHRVLPPWNTSLPAQLAGIAALREKGYLEKTRKLIREEKHFLTEKLAEGLVKKLYDSDANFLCFQARTDLKERLLEQKILIRSCDSFRGMGDGFFRIAIRTREENEELIRRFRQIEKGMTNGKSNYDTGHNV